MKKPIIYQILPRLWGNDKTRPKRHGTLTENGTGKLSDIDTKTLEYLKFSEMRLEDKCEKVDATIDKLNRFKEMKLGTASAKNLWLQRLDYYIGFYDKLKAQLDNSTEIL